MRLKIFEARDQMSSETFYRRFRAGELGDTADVVEWSVFYEMWQAVQERLEGARSGIGVSGPTAICERH